jgi:mono/diheme cytochrome c family protein
MMIWAILFLAQAAAPTQIDRGEALFTDSANGCVSCHALKGKGTAVGPDLRGVARLSPKGIAMAIRSTVAQYVQTAKVKDVGTFPAYVGAQDDKTMDVFDLSKTPAELHKVPKADVQLTGNNGWKHPPSERKYTDEQLADVVAYIRYAGAGNRQQVSPADIK